MAAIPPTFGVEELRAALCAFMDIPDEGQDIPQLMMKFFKEGYFLLEQNLLEIGPPGKSAYEIAVEQGFSGSQEQWLNSLKVKGEPGPPGNQGPPGPIGNPGPEGDSAYELAVAQGFHGSMIQWLASLKGDPGNNFNVRGTLDSELDLPEPPPNPLDAYLIDGDLWIWDSILVSWTNSGPVQGPTGESTYDIAVKYGYTGTEEEWIDSITPEVPGGTAALDNNAKIKETQFPDRLTPTGLASRLTDDATPEGAALTGANGFAQKVKEVGGATLATGIPASTTTWTHSAPNPSKAWAYTTRCSSGSPVLASAYSANSPTVQLQAPPSAPTNLSPSAADATEAITLSWSHNPVDMSDQSAYEVQARATSADPWSALGGKTTSGTSSRTVSAGTWSNGGSVRWRVRTWGADVDPSPWSAEQVLNLSARPVAGISLPDGTWESQRVTVTWTYFDEESSAQSGWEAQLLAGGGGNQALASMSGQASGARRTTFSATVADGGSYSVRVRVRDGSGLWSEWASRSFTVSYAPPPTPTLAVQWHGDDGYATLDMDVPSPSGSLRPVDRLRVERSSPQGWVPVAGGEVWMWPVTIVDMTPPLGQAVQYRVVAVSDIDSEAYSPTATVDTKACWLFINHGPGFGQVVRVWGNLQAGRTYGRAKVLHRFVGRSLPVERAGGHVTRTYSLTARLFAPWLPPDPTSTWDDVEALAAADAPVLVRDPEGVRLFCSVGDVSLDGHLEVGRTVSIPLTVVDWDES